MCSGLEDNWVKILWAGAVFVFIFKFILWVLTLNSCPPIKLSRFLIMCVFKCTVLFYLTQIEQSLIILWKQIAISEI